LARVRVEDRRHAAARNGANRHCDGRGRRREGMGEGVRDELVQHPAGRHEVLLRDVKLQATRGRVLEVLRKERHAAKECCERVLRKSAAQNDRLTNDRLTNDRLTNDRLTNDRLTNDRPAHDRPAHSLPARVSTCLVRSRLPLVVLHSERGAHHTSFHSLVSCFAPLVLLVAFALIRARP